MKITNELEYGEAMLEFTKLWNTVDHSQRLEELAAAISEYEGQCQFLKFAGKLTEEFKDWKEMPSLAEHPESFNLNFFKEPMMPNAVYPTCSKRVTFDFYFDGGIVMVLHDMLNPHVNIIEEVLPEEMDEAIKRAKIIMGS